MVRPLAPILALERNAVTCARPKFQSSFHLVREAMSNLSELVCGNVKGNGNLARSLRHFAQTLTLCSTRTHRAWFPNCEASQARPTQQRRKGYTMNLCCLWQHTMTMQR